MSKALVYKIGGAPSDTFRTNWAEFMKNNFLMKLLIYPFVATIDKSDAKMQFNPAIPKAMFDAHADTDELYYTLWFKDDTGTIQSGVFSKTIGDFEDAKEIQAVDFMVFPSPVEFNITGANVTAGVKYLVNVVFSDQSITSEVVENPGDLPYSKYGAVSGYVIEVIAVA